jgi:formylmethanofuran dehydrogenase subunit E
MSTEKLKTRRVYIGMANVRPKHEMTILDKHAAAVVNVLACANSEKDFAKQAERTFLRDGLEMFELEEIEVFCFERNQGIRKQDLLAKAKLALDTQQVVFDTFYTY